MWALSTITKRIASIVLAMALVIAPVAPAAAACMSSKSTTHLIAASESKAPCDMPCKDCSPGTEQSCQGDCIVATTAFISPADAGVRAVSAAQPDPEPVTTTRALVHPPDTPPPRIILAQF